MWWKKNKYGATRVEKAGRRYDSKSESALHDLLLLEEKAGLIKNIRQQQTIYLTEARIGMRPDFTVWDKEFNQDVFAEFKGFETDAWLIKLKLYRVYGDRPMKIYRGTPKNVYLAETVLPKFWKEGKHDN